MPQPKIAHKPNAIARQGSAEHAAWLREQEHIKAFHAEQVARTREKQARDPWRLPAGPEERAA